MTDITDLYDDEQFNDELLRLAQKNLLPFDDYRQEVFLHLIEHKHPAAQSRQVAKKIAMRMRRKQIREATVSLVTEEYGGDDSADAASMLWEDRHIL